MIVRHEGSVLAIPLGELDVPREPLDVLSFAGSRPAAAGMVGHRPVVHCTSGASLLPLPEHGYPAWLFGELVALKAVGA